MPKAEPSALTERAHPARTCRRPHGVWVTCSLQTWSFYVFQSTATNSQATANPCSIERRKCTEKNKRTAERQLHGLPFTVFNFCKVLDFKRK